MKQVSFILFLLVAMATTSTAQKLTSMQWFNEPSEWSVDNNKLVMQVTGQTDYWRKSHYGFTVDDGPFLSSERGGEFEVSVKLTGEYKSRFDQMGLMLRIDEKNWIKTGIEYVDGVYNFSTVQTVNYSSWSVVALPGKPDAIWVKAIRKRDAVEIFYSLDGVNFQMSNTAYLPECKVVKVGMMGASPDGEGFKATFENFTIKHLADERRLEWLENNK